MGRFDFKSIIFGIGLGIIFTSFLSYMVVGMNGVIKAQTQTDTANTKYVSDSGVFIADEKNENKKENIGSGGSEPTIIPSAKPTEQLKEIGDEFVIFQVRTGDTSETVTRRLFEAGLISKKESFLKELENGGYDKVLREGSYKLRKGMSNKEIIKTIARY